MPLLRLGCGQYSGQAYSENDQGDRSTSKENASRCRYARLRRGAPLPRPDQSFARRRGPRRGRASGPVRHRAAAAWRDGTRHEPATHDTPSGMEAATETRPYDQRTIVAWCRQAWTMKHKRLFLRFWPRGRPMDQYVRARSLGRYPGGQTGAAPCPPSMRQSTACSPKIWCSLAGRVRPLPDARDRIASVRRSKTKFADLTCVYCHERAEPYCRRSNASVRPREQKGHLSVGDPSTPKEERALPRQGPLLLEPQPASRAVDSKSAMRSRHTSSTMLARSATRSPSQASSWAVML